MIQTIMIQDDNFHFEANFCTAQQQRLRSKPHRQYLPVLWPILQLGAADELNEIILTNLTDVTLLRSYFLAYFLLGTAIIHALKQLYHDLFANSNNLSI